MATKPESNLVKNQATSAEHLLQKSKNLRQTGNSNQARKILLGLIAKYPDYVGALFELGSLHITKGEFDKALDYVLRAAIYNPKDYRSLANLAALCYEMDANDMAVLIGNYAVSANANNSESYFNLGNAYLKLREYELAAENFSKALVLEPQHLATALNLGKSYEHLGEVEKAADIYHKAMNENPRNHTACLLAISSLPNPLVKINLLKALSKVEIDDSIFEGEHQVDFGFLKARVLENTGNHEQAWQQIIAANREVFQGVEALHKDDMELGWQMFEWVKSRPKNFTLNQSIGQIKVSPLFVLGTSRSGKTTLERILAKFSEVKCGYENHLLTRCTKAANQVAGRLSSHFLPLLPESLVPTFCQFFIDDLAKMAGEASLLTTTTPGNINYLTHIMATIPQTKAIFVKRNRQDAALRMLFKKYRTGNSYSYCLKAIYQHMDWYDAMIELICEKYPERTIIVNYEEAAMRPGRIAKILSQFCEIEMPLEKFEITGSDIDCAKPYLDWMAEEASG